MSPSSSVTLVDQAKAAREIILGVAHDKPAFNLLQNAGAAVGLLAIAHREQAGEANRLAASLRFHSASIMSRRSPDVAATKRC